MLSYTKGLKFLRKLTFIFLATSILVVSFLSPAQIANAEEAPVNNCVNKKTGVVRPVPIATCLKTEWAIGAHPIVPKKYRPNKINAFLANRIKAAQLAGKQAGFTIRIKSGWRSLSYQKKIYRQRTTNKITSDDLTALPPEQSMHPWGLAVDLSFSPNRKEGSAWLETNGYKYGLCRTYENEWWHFEPTVAPGQPCPAPVPYPVAQ